MIFEEFEVFEIGRGKNKISEIFGLGYYDEDKDEEVGEVDERYLEYGYVEEEDEIFERYEDAGEVDERYLEYGYVEEDEDIF